MPKPISDGHKTYVTNGAADGIVRANILDADGSNLHGLGGEDHLKGGKFNDTLDGGSGNDFYYGGAGADVFRIDIRDIVDGHDTDTLFDLTFSEGDILSLDGFAAGTFHDLAGADATRDGTHVRISSFEGLHNALTSASGISVSAMQKGSTNTLILNIDDHNGHLQTLVIKDAYHEFMAAGGLIA